MSIDSEPRSVRHVRLWVDGALVVNEEVDLDEPEFHEIDQVTDREWFLEIYDPQAGNGGV